MLLAKIREIDCIGCGKCLDACPVDAILGAPKFMHTVLEQECIGCKLCVAPCPMDCIEILEASQNQAPLSIESIETKKTRAELAKKRFQARKKRLLSKESLKLAFLPREKSAEYEEKIQQEIKQAIERVFLKKKNQTPPFSSSSANNWSSTHSSSTTISSSSPNTSSSTNPSSTT